MYTCIHLINGPRCEKTCLRVCEQQRRRPVCTSAQTYQRHCYSLYWKYHITIWSFQGGASFVDPFCYLSFVLVFVTLSCLFLAALWSPAVLAVLWVMFSCVLSPSDMVSWLRCGTWLYRFLIFAPFLHTQQWKKAMPDLPALTLIVINPKMNKKILIKHLLKKVWNKIQYFCW